VLALIRETLDLFMKDQLNLEVTSYDYV